MRNNIHPDPMKAAHEEILSLSLNQSLIKITGEGAEIVKRLNGVVETVNRLAKLERDGIASEDDVLAMKSMAEWAKAPKERIEAMRNDYAEQIHRLLSIDRHGKFLKTMTVGQAEALAMGDDENGLRG